jgi:hypothetical protein
MVNRERSEVTIVLGGKEYCLRPTFQALAEIEARAGVGLIKLMRRFVDHEFGLKDVLAVLGPAIEAGGVKPPVDLGDRIVETGIANFFGPVSEFLALALGGAATGD